MRNLFGMVDKVVFKYDITRVVERLVENKISFILTYEDELDDAVILWVRDTMEILAKTIEIIRDCERG